MLHIRLWFILAVFDIRVSTFLFSIPVFKRHIVRPSKQWDESYRETWDTRIPQWLRDRLIKSGFEQPSPVQVESSKLLYDGKSAVIEAETGSGKTLAYLLPLLSQIDSSKMSTQGIVIVPTRELGLQVKSVASQLINGSPGRIEIMALLEGSRNRRQRAWAWSSPPHVVIANPETLELMVSKGGLFLNKVKFLVVDEIDSCGDTFTTRGQALHNLLSKHLCSSYDKVSVERGKVVNVHINEVVKKRHVEQIVFASASIPQRARFVRDCVQKHWLSSKNPPVVLHMRASSLNTFIRTPPQILHQVIYCDAKEQKVALLRKLVKHLLLSGGMTRGIIFSKPGRPIHEIVKILNFDIDNLILKQKSESIGHVNVSKVNDTNVVGMLLEESGLNERALAMTNLRLGLHKLIIATDSTVSRGIDIVEMSHIIQFDLPDNDDVYLHRGGRCGRMGRNGTVLSLASKHDQFIVRRLSNCLNIPITDITDTCFS